MACRSNWRGGVSAVSTLCVGLGMWLGLAAMHGAWAREAVSRTGPARAQTQAQTQVPWHAQTVTLKRTPDGMAHVRASDWRGAGLGVGYAQAEDALCTLADAFTTFEGRRAYHFGADASPRYNATFTGGNNLELDVFFRAFLDAGTIQSLRAKQPAELLDLIDGYVEGYNRHVREAGASARLHPDCAGAPWVRQISADDVLRRMHAAAIAAGYAHFIPQIVHARPPDAPLAQMAQMTQMTQVAPSLQRPHSSWTVGEQAGVGSNMVAVGAARPGESAVLFGNPHWYWGGPDRFHQVHIVIADRLNVAGATFLGVPLVMIGFNAHVAWSHTVSKAKRFGLYVMQLDPQDPTAYLVDGVREPMVRTEVAVPVRDSQGRDAEVRRTLYRTRFGPLIDLGARAPAWGWGRSTAIAIRDVNADNDRVFRHYLAWNQAVSLDDFVAIQRRELAVPWVNTAAIGQGDARVWYADMGAVPNVSDALKAACATPLSQAFARLDDKVPVLDGARAACAWPLDPHAAQPGAMAADAQPWLFREDYVANMNDSHWLSNPNQTLEGFASVLGGEREPLTLRGRHGHVLAQQVIAASGGSSARVMQGLERQGLAAVDHAAVLFKSALLGAACAKAVVQVKTEQAMQPVDVTRACGLLRAWGHTADADDRGALLWNAFWQRVNRIPGRERFDVPFDFTRPLETPSLSSPQEDPRVAEALGATVLDFARQGRPLDEPVGHRLFVRTEGQRLPLYGGCGGGYFTVACAEGEPANEEMDERAHANSHLQVVRFGPAGPQAHVLLAHGQQETAVRGGAGGAPVRAYARRQWQPVAFSDADVARAPGTVRVLTVPPGQAPNTH